MRARVTNLFHARRPAWPWRKPQLAVRPLRGYTSLFAARLFALDVMGPLRAFDPRLRGAALSGRWRFDSVVDLDVYADRMTVLGDHLRDLGWRAEMSHYDDGDDAHPTFEVDGLFPLVLHVLPTEALLPLARGIDRDALLAEVRQMYRTQLTRWCASRVE